MNNASESLQVPVLLSLDSAVNQINNLKKQLQEGVKVDSTSFKTINSMLDRALKQANDLKTNMGQAFQTSSGSKKFLSDLNKVFNQISSAGGMFDYLKESDLLFPEETQQRITQIRTEMEALQGEIRQIQSGKVGKLFEDSSVASIQKVRQVANDISVDLSKTTFQSFTQKIDAAMQKTQEEIDKTSNKIKSMEAIVNNGKLNKDSIINELNSTISSKDITSKVLTTSGAEKARKAITELYTKEFNLTPNTNLGLQVSVNKNVSKVLEGQMEEINKSTDQIKQNLENKKNELQNAINELITLRDKNKNSEGETVNWQKKLDIVKQMQEKFKDIEFIDGDSKLYSSGRGISQYLTDLITQLTENIETLDVDKVKESMKLKLKQVFDNIEGKDVITDVKGFKDSITEIFAKYNINLNDIIKIDPKTFRNTELSSAINTVVSQVLNSFQNIDPAEQQEKLQQLSAALLQLGEVRNIVAQTGAQEEASLEGKKSKYEELSQIIAQVVAERLQLIHGGVGQVFEQEGDSADKAKESIRQYAEGLANIESKQKALTNVQSAVKHWMGFYQVLNLTKRAVQEMRQHIQELDSVMTQIAVVTNMSQEDLWGQIGKYSQIARQYGVAIKGVYEVSQIYYQQGLNQNDTMILTTETLKMARIAGLDYATAADYMTTAIRGFKLEMSDAAHVTDVYSALAATTASSTEELAVAISKTASSAEAVGSSFEATTAMMATMIATTRESATNIGTALKSVISRYGEMTSDPSKLVDSEGEEMSLNRVDKALQTVGIKIHDVNGQFRDFDDVILELGEKWNGLDKNAQRYIATLMAGNRQQSRFLALVGNIDEYKKALETAENAEGTGELQTLKTLDSIDARIERMKVTVQEFYTSAGIEELYKNILDTITNVIDAANHLPKMFDKIPTTAIAVGANLVMAIKNILSLIISEIAAGIDKAKAHLDLTLTKTISSAREKGREIGKATEEGRQEGERQAQSGTTFSKGLKSVAGTAARYLGAAFSAAGSALTISSLSKYGSSTTPTEDRISGWHMLGGAGAGILGNTLSGAATGGLPGAIAGALTGVISNFGNLVSAFDMLNVSTARQIELAEKRLEQAKQQEAEAKNESKTLETAYNKLIELQKHQYDSVEDAKEYAEYMNQLADSYPQFIDSISVNGDILINVTSMEEALAEARLATAQATMKSLKGEKEVLEARKQSVEELLTSLSFDKIKSSEINTINLKETANSLYDSLKYSMSWDQLGKYEFNPAYALYEQYINSVYRNNLNTEFRQNTLKNSKIYGFNFKKYDEELGYIFEAPLLKNGLIDEESIYNWIIKDVEAKPENLNTFYKNLYNSAVNNGEEVLTDAQEGVRKAILQAIKSYISIDENKDFLKQFDKLSEEEDPYKAIEKYSYEELIKLASQMRIKVQRIFDNYQETIGTIEEAITNSDIEAKVQDRINNLLSTSKSSGQKLQKYVKFISSMFNTVDEVVTKEGYTDKYNNLETLILSDTTTADKLMNLDYSQFSSFYSIESILTNGWEKYADAFKENFEAIRNAALEGMENQINELEELKNVEQIISFNEEGNAESGLITQLIPSLRAGLAEYKNLLDKGLFSDARIYGENLVEFYKLIAGVSDSVQLEIASIVKNIDFSDSSSLRAAAEELSKVELEKGSENEVDITSAAEVLKQAANSYRISVSTILEQLKETTINTAKTLEEAFDNQTKSLSKSEAMKAAEELLKNYTEDDKSQLNWRDLYKYNSDLGGYVATEKALEIAIGNTTKENNNRLKEVSKQNKNAKAIKEFIDSNKEYYATFPNYETASEDARKAMRATIAGQIVLKGQPGEYVQEELEDLYDQMMQDIAVGGYETFDEFWEVVVSEWINDEEEAAKETQQMTSEAAVDWLRKQNYDIFAAGSYTETDFNAVRTALQKALGENSNEELLNELWDYLIEGQLENFQQTLKNYGVDLKLSSKSVSSAAQSNLKQHQNALDEIVSGKTFDIMSKETQQLVAEESMDMLQEAWEEVEAIRNDAEATDEDYQEALAKFLEFKQSQDQVASLINQIEDGTISATENLVSQLIKDDGSGELIEAAQDYLEKDLKGGFKLKKGVSLIQAAEGLAKALELTLDPNSEAYKELLSKSIDLQIKNLDEQDISKQALSQLQSLASAKAGTRVRVDKIPTEIIQKLGISAVDGIYQIQSEFQMQAALMALQTSDFKDPASQQWIRQVKQEYESKKPVQQQALQNVITSSFSMDQARTLLKSLYPETDIDNLTDDLIQRRMKRYGFNWDSFTQQFTPTINAIGKINELIQQYAAEGASPEAINALTALVRQLEYQLGDGRKYGVLSTIIENSEHVTEDMLAELKTAYQGVDISSALSKKQADGTFKVNIAVLLELLGNVFNDLVNQASDIYIKNIQSILSMATSGTTSIAQMEQFKSDFAGAKFDYDEILGVWRLDATTLKPILEAQAKLLAKNGTIKPEDINSWIQKQIDSFTIDQIDVSGILATNSKEDQQKYRNIIIDYYKTHSQQYGIFGTPEAIKEWAESQADNTISILRAGGEAAITEIKKIKGDKTTQEDIEAAFKTRVNVLQSVFDLLNEEMIGTVVSDEQKVLLESAGFTIDPTGVITAVGSMVDAYQKLYDEMKVVAGATQADINSAYAKLRTAQEQGDIDAIAAMGDAMGMTYETLGEILAKQQGWDLETWLKNNSNLYQSIGAGKIRLTDFTAFAAQMGWQPGSEEYTSAFKTYNDSLIEFNKQTEKSIEEEIKGLENVKGGDQLNLTELYTELQKQIITIPGKMGNVYEAQNPFNDLQVELSNYGASLVKGILTLDKDANLIGVAQALTVAAEKAGIEISAEIQDMIQNIIKSYAEAITNGIKGTLDNTGREDLINKAASLGITNLQFTQTTEGFKLAQNSAIQLYGTIRQIDAIQGKLIFDELNKSLQESNEHYSGISDIMSRIAWIEDQEHPARAQQYSQELALAKEILAIRSTTEDDSFNFMSKKIPSGQNNPINYYENWAKAVNTLNDAFENQGTYTKRNINGEIIEENIKSGFVDYQDWYNIVTELNNIAALGGPIEFAGQKLNGSLEAAAALIEKGAASLVATDTGEIKVALSGMELNFEEGADAFSGGVEDGIRSLAKGQIKMLDGMIQLLETVVAMEKLGDITNGDNTIDLVDLFPDVNWEEGKNQIIKNEQALQWINNELLKAPEDSEIGKFISNVKLNGQNLREMLHNAVTAEEGVTEENAKALSSLMNSLWQMYQSGEYNLDDLYSSIQQIANTSNLDLVVPMGDTTLYVKHGAVIVEELDDKGNTKFTTSSGASYDTFEEAVARSALAAYHVENIEYDEKIATGTIKFTLDNQNIEVEVKSNANGEVSFEANGTQYTDWNQYVKEVVLKGADEEVISQKSIEIGLQLGTVKLNSTSYKAIDSGIRQEIENAFAVGDTIKIQQLVEATPVFKQLKGKSIEEIAQTLGIITETQIINVNAETQNADNALEETKKKAEEIDALTPVIDVSVNNQTESGIDSVLASLSRIPGSKNVRVNAIGNFGKAIGNAQAKGTLMGELGPELVVQNGRYFVAGQNGAEFVNLTPDAIVFNHLQTKQLLKNGMSSSRGHAVTNERVATAYAKGNAEGGPAMASASAALAALRQLRAQWQALAGLSLVDLAKKGGGGGGGGGNDKDIAPFLRDVERWYNWLQKIADLEKQINYEEQLRSKIESDMISNGKAYYASQKRTYEQARESALTSQSLFISQKEYFEERQQQLQNAPIGDLYTFDPTSGQTHYKDSEAKQWLEQLFESRDKYGGAALTPEQQYNMILARNPEFEKYMKYNESGLEIKKEDYEKNEQQYFVDKVKAFSDILTEEQESFQELFDSWNEQRTAVLEQLQTMNEQLEAMKDNQKEVEEAVLNAIVDSREREIKTIEDTKDALQKTNEDFINGLSNQLDKERSMYEKQQNNQELERNRRQLAILQRSGGSAAQIARLQEQIRQQEQDTYFDKQQEQIDAVKEASDLQIKKLDLQIELMNTQLEYEKANGLLWGQVYEVMSKSPKDIAGFIQEKTSEYWDQSPLVKAKNGNDWIFKAEQWESFRDDFDAQAAALGHIDESWGIFIMAMKEMLGDKWTPEMEAAAKSIYDSKLKETADPNAAAEAAYNLVKPPKEETSNIENTIISEATSITEAQQPKKTFWKYKYEQKDDKQHYKIGLYTDGSWASKTAENHDGNPCSKCGYKASYKGGYSVVDSLKDSPNALRKLTRYDHGGMVEEDGPAFLHADEGVLNPVQTKMLREDILGRKSNSLANILSDLQATWAGNASINDYNSINRNSSTVIENAVVQMNVQRLANDYDARRAGQNALDEMLRIARKSAATSVRG